MPAPAHCSCLLRGLPCWLYSWPSLALPPRAGPMCPWRSLRTFYSWPRRSCPRRFPRLRSAVGLAGRVPIPSVCRLRGAAARCLSAAFLSRASRCLRCAFARWLVASSVCARGGPTAGASHYCCPVVSSYTRGFRHQGGMSPQPNCLTPAVRCTVASGLFLSHCPPRLALERARARTRAPDRDVRHESSFLLPRCATVWNLLHAARYSSDS